MNKHRSDDDHPDMTSRLRQLEQLLAPKVMAQRSAADDAIESLSPLLNVDKHMGQMYVAGHEPHFRPVILLKPSRSSGHDDLELD